MCVDLLWSRFNKLPARRKKHTKLSKSTSYLFIFYSLHTTQILGLCLSVAITFWLAVSSRLGSLFWLPGSWKSFSRILAQFSLSLSFFSQQKVRRERLKKNVTKPKPMTHTLRLGLCALCASPWPSRPRCSPIKSGQMPHSAVVVVVGFVRQAPLPPSATKQSKAEKRSKCGQKKTSAALMGEREKERGS